MHPHFVQFLTPLLLAIGIAGPAAAGDLRIPLPNHRFLLLTVPDTWKEQVRRASPELPPTVALSPKSGTDFHVLLTPGWVPKSAPQPTAQSLRLQVSSVADAAKSQAVETNLPILEFVSPHGIASYFSATDRAPKPGEYKNLTQGILAIAELRVAFTILSNGNRAAILDPALAVIRSIRLE